MADQAQRDSADEGRGNGSKMKAWTARAACVVSTALLTAVDIRRTSDSDVMTAADWNRLFAYARQHMPGKAGQASYNMGQAGSNATDAMHMLRDHAIALSGKVYDAATNYTINVSEALHNAASGISRATIESTLSGLNRMGGIAATCDDAIRTVGGLKSTFQVCFGWECPIQNKLIAVSQGMAQSLNGTNNIVIQNETINRISEICIGQMNGLMQQLMVNITSLRF
ncbi:MAG: hypothetical protein KGH58_01970 [Candidatus Micrarchaeota archaeon]|nr:hypothetical protein [Candidatus Micrarchaeota archaeon]